MKKEVSLPVLVEERDRVYYVEYKGERHSFRSAEEAEAFLRSQGHDGLIVVIECDYGPSEEGGET